MKHYLLKVMPMNSAAFANEFSTRNLASILTKHVFPGDGFDPEGAWEHRYDIGSLVNQVGTWPIQTGTLILRRTPAPDGTVLLETVHRSFVIDKYPLLSTPLAVIRRNKPAIVSGRLVQWDGRDVDHTQLISHVRTVEGRMRCNRDTLASPIEWGIASRTETVEGALCPYSTLTKSGSVEKGRVCAATGKVSRAFHVVPPFTTNWALFDAVQRLDVRLGEVLRFTLLDHLDEPKPEQELRQHWPADPDGQALENPTDWPWRGFQQTGRGVVPTVYWVDKNRRLVLVQSGLEVFLLTASEPKGLNSR